MGRLLRGRYEGRRHGPGKWSDGGMAGEPSAELVTAEGWVLEARVIDEPGLEVRAGLVLADVPLHVPYGGEGNR